MSGFREREAAVACEINVSIVRWGSGDPPKAVLVRSEYFPDRTAWLPLSQIELSENDDGSHACSLPEWLALEKRLL